MKNPVVETKRGDVTLSHGDLGMLLLSSYNEPRSWPDSPRSAEWLETLGLLVSDPSTSGRNRVYRTTMKGDALLADICKKRRP